MEFKDYYQTLGVAKDSSAKEIKASFRRLARKLHPDVNPGDKVAEARFKDINEAYEVLGDPAKRKKYDELGANWRMYEQAPQSGANGPSPFGGQYAWGGGTSGFRPMTEDEAAQFFGDQEDGAFSDFFRTFFGGAAPAAEAAGGRPRSSRVRSRPGRDVEHPIELGLEDVLNGSVRRFALQHGDDTRAVEVRIPPGVTEGSRVRVSGGGERGLGEGGSGDLYLRVKLRAHPRFERQGRDLHTKVKLPVTTAVLGGEVDVPTLSGRTLRLKVPSGTQNGQVFRLRGHGLPATGKADEPGDLYATVDVMLPASITPEVRGHYEALAALEREGRN